MTDERLSGLALIAGSLGSVVTMALHPTGHDLFQPGQFQQMAHLGVIAHSLALISVPVIFLGAVGLSHRLAAPDRLAVVALVLYGTAAVAVMNAAVLNGFVAPSLIQEILESAPPERDTWHIVLGYNSRVSQAFVKVFVAASSTAILLWSASILRSGVLARAAGIYGCIAAPVILFALLSGHLRLNVHGFGLVVLGQAAWFIWIGILLWRFREK